MVYEKPNYQNILLLSASSISQNSSGPCPFENDDLNWSSVTKSVIIFVHLTCRLCYRKIMKGT